MAHGRLLLLVRVLTLVRPLWAQLDTRPLTIEFVQHLQPKTLSVTFDKAVCGKGFIYPRYMSSNTGDIRISNLSTNPESEQCQRRVNYLGDVVEPAESGASTIFHLDENGALLGRRRYPDATLLTHSQNGKWCWTAFQLFNFNKLISDTMFIKSHYGDNRTESWWGRKYKKVNIRERNINNLKDGGIIYKSDKMRYIVENTTITSTWKGSLETVTVPFPAFKCAFAGVWKMDDGDSTTFTAESDPYKVYEVVMSERIITHHEEFQVTSGDTIKLQFKPGFSELLKCQVVSTAAVRYKWHWEVRSRPGADNPNPSFVPIDPRWFEVLPKTVAKSTVEQRRVFDDPDEPRTRLCRIQTTTGRMGILMDKDRFNGSQVRCILKHTYDAHHVYSVLNYTINITYDWEPVKERADQTEREKGGIDFTRVSDCTPYQITFGVFTFFTCVALVLSFKVYREKGALHKEKWRSTRVPPVDPKHFRKLLRKYIKEMKRDRSSKSRFSQVLSKTVSIDDTTEKGEEKAKKENKNRSNAKPKENRNESHVDDTETESESSHRNGKGSCFDPTKDPSNTWTPSRGAGSFAYMNSNQYYADLRACLEDADQTYDDRGGAGLKSRHKDCYTSFRDTNVSWEDVVGSGSDDDDADDTDNTDDTTSGDNSSGEGDTIVANDDKHSNVMWAFLGRIGLRKRRL